MTVYCSHTKKTFTKSSNYYLCHFCGFGWYGFEPIPLVVIGYTDPYEASPNHQDSFIEKDLSKKNWSRCTICKDLLEKRKHRICTLKLYLKGFRKRHQEILTNIMIVIRSFRKNR